MAKLYYSESISGIANQTVYGSGITSTEAEPKTLKSIYIVTSARQGNIVEGWYEREKRLDIIDTVLPIVTDAFRFTIPIEFDIDTGKTWKVALKSGGTPTAIYVVYEYELR